MQHKHDNIPSFADHPHDSIVSGVTNSASTVISVSFISARITSTSSTKVSYEGLIGGGSVLPKEMCTVLFKNNLIALQNPVRVVSTLLENIFEKTAWFATTLPLLSNLVRYTT